LSRLLINRFSDYPVRAIAPIDAINLTVLNDAAGASCQFKVFDPSKDSVLTASEAIGQTELSVASAGIFVVGEKVECTQDDDSFHTSTITVVDPVAGTITIANPTTVAMATGNRVRVILDSAIAMVEYGTADLNTRDWGYIGTFPDTHEAHKDSRAKDGFDVNIEIQFNGGSGLAKLDVHCVTIKENICDS